ncbi:hypothetical protein HYV44_03715 [Candidatus Microgenomates bacterium]|nr:hypothetical protein [Candidatus Microgenomates bacterium]
MKPNKEEKAGDTQDDIKVFSRKEWDALMSVKNGYDLEKMMMYYRYAPKDYGGISENRCGQWLTTGAFFAVRDMETNHIIIQSRPRIDEKGSYCSYHTLIDKGDLSEFLDFLNGDYEIICKDRKYQLVVTKTSHHQLSDITGKEPITIQSFNPYEREEALRALENLDSQNN